VTSGFVQVRDQLQVGGTLDGYPSAVIRASGADSEFQKHGGRVVIGNPTGPHVAIDDNDITTNDGSQWATLRINANGAPITMGQYDIRPALAYGVVRVIQSAQLGPHSENVTGVTKLEDGEFQVHVQGGLDPATDIVVCSGLDRGAIASAKVGWVDGVYDIRVSLLNAFLNMAPSNSDFSFVVYRQ
jgi:hypothetical protein